MQGKGAAEDIVSMLSAISELRDIDMLVIGRGGGSLEDLWPFNEEKVIRAMAVCDIPIISAVGHEIDYTLSDFVADYRAETPSAAAEHIFNRFQDYMARLSHTADSLEDYAYNRIERLDAFLKLQKSRLEGLSPKQLIEQYYLRLDDISNRLQAFLKEGIANGRNRIGELVARLYAVSPDSRYRLAALHYKSVKDRYYRYAHIAMDKRREQINQLSKRLRDISPQQTLKRGFVLVRNENGDIVSRKKGLVKGNKLNNQFYDGDIEVTVN